MSMPALRDVLRPGDVAPLTAIAARTGVFSAVELGYIAQIADEIFAAGPAAGYGVLIAEHAGRPCGFAVFGPITGTAGRYDLYWIATDPGLQRQGIAASLLRETVARVRAAGGTHLFIETSTRADYAPARNFYAREGFPLIATVPDYYADGDGLAVFGARLDALARAPAAGGGSR